MLALNELLAGVIGLMILCGLVMLATCGGWWLLMRDRDESKEERDHE